MDAAFTRTPGGARYGATPEELRARPGAAIGHDHASDHDHWSLFQATPTPLILVDRDTLHIVAVNQAASRAFGYSAAEFLASSIADFVAPKDRDDLLRSPHAMSGPDLLEGRSSWVVLRRGGQTTRLQVAPGTALSFGGKSCTLLFQPPEAEATARDARLDGVDAAGFSFSAIHDLKEPIHLVRGYLALLRQDANSLSATNREYLEEAYLGTERLQAIVLNLLEYFRAGAKGSAPEPLPLQDVLDATLRSLRLQVDESHAILTTDSLPTVMADRLQVERLLQNLLGNALKFRGDAAPRIHVGARRDGRFWEIWVKDNGIGIAEKDLQRVLQPFQRAHSSDKYPGTGLGLSIVKKIIDVHGGRLWLVSNLDSGTEVHFTLPATEA